MKAGWETKTLGDVVVASGSVDPTKEPDRLFRYVDVSSVSNELFEILDAQELLGRDAPSRARRLIKTDDVLFATIRPTLKRIAMVPPNLDGQICSTGYFVFRTKPFLDPRFLFYFLRANDFLDAMERLQTGASYPAVNDSQVRQQEIRFPPLPEQRRIVSILDEAFAGLEVMRANAEKNLQNARELFEHCVSATFSRGGEGWIATTVGEQITLQRGFDITKDQQKSGNVPVVSSGGIKSFHNTAMVKGPGVIIGRKGTLGKAFYLQEDFWPHDTTLWVKDFKGNQPLFVFYFLANLKVQHLDSGAANPALNRNQVHPIATLWPPPDVQQRLASTFYELSERSKALEEIYRQKLAAIDELKQSILQKAFAGELTSAEAVAA